MKKRIIAFAILLVSGAALVTELVLYSQNNLSLNGQWIVEKKMAQVGLAGGDSFLTSRSALAQNRLQLGTWWGFHEVTYRPQVEPALIQFSFQIKESAEICLFFGKTKGYFSGVRFSHNPAHPSGYIKATSQGEIQILKPFDFQDPKFSWRKATLKFAGNTLLVELDGSEIFRSDLQMPTTGQVSIRAGVGEAILDDVVIRDQSGIEYGESFSNSKDFFRLLGLNIFLGFLSIVIVVFIFSIRLGRPDFNKSIDKGLFFFSGIICSVICFYVFDFFYWSKLPIDNFTPPIATEMKSQQRMAYETARHGFFRKWYGLVSHYGIRERGFLEQGYPAVRIWAGPVICEQAKECMYISGDDRDSKVVANKHEFRIIFVGTSQTIGAGAQVIDDTFFARTHHALAAKLGSKLGIKSLNISISAFDAERMLIEYRKHVSFAPDLAVINLSGRDVGESIRFTKNMRDFLEINKKQGIQTVLLEEARIEDHGQFAVSPRVVDQRLLQNHEILRRLGKEYKVTVLPFHSYMRELELKDNGYLWWDQSHMTSYGHEMVARWLAPHLLEVIKKSRKGSRLNRSVEVSTKTGNR